MATVEIIFTIVILIWIFCGFMGMLHCNNGKVNYWFIIFFLAAPFLVAIAKIYGLT